MNHYSAFTPEIKFKKAIIYHNPQQYYVALRKASVAKSA